MKVNANFGNVTKSDVSALFDSEQKLIVATLRIHFRQLVSVGQDGSKGQADVTSYKIPKKTILGMIRNIFGYYSDGHIEKLGGGNNKIYRHKSDNALYKDLVDAWGEEFFPSKKVWKDRLYKKSDNHQIVFLYDVPQIKPRAIIVDYYTQSRHALSKDNHLNGLRNMDSSHSQSKSYHTERWSDKRYRNHVKNYMPEYSKSPAKKVYILPEQDYIDVDVKIGERMFEHLCEKLKERTGYFIGNSESHCDVELFRKN